MNELGWLKVTGLGLTSTLFYQGFEKETDLLGALSLLKPFFIVARETEASVPYGFTFSP